MSAPSICDPSSSSNRILSSIDLPESNKDICSSIILSPACLIISCSRRVSPPWLASSKSWSFSRSVQSQELGLAGFKPSRLLPQLPGRLRMFPLILPQLVRRKMRREFRPQLSFLVPNRLVRQVPLEPRGPGLRRYGGLRFGNGGLGRFRCFRRRAQGNVS